MGQPHFATGLPFSAQREEVEVAHASDGSRVERRREGALYRDRHGRTRSEFEVPRLTGGVARVALLVDPAASRMRAVDADSGELLTGNDDQTDGAGDAPERPAIEPRRPGKGTPRSEDLGWRQIEGLACHGSRIRFEDGELEIWEARELGPDPPVLRRSVVDGHEYRERVFNIRLGDPDQRLFDALTGP